MDKTIELYFEPGQSVERLDRFLACVYVVAKKLSLSFRLLKRLKPLPSSFH